MAHSVTRLARHLHHGWTVSASGDDVPDHATTPIPARIPGTSRTALLEAGLGEGREGASWHRGATWRFTTHFAATPATPGERVDLVLDGLDTAATVFLNGAEVGRTANMHRTFRFDVARHVLGGDNELAVEFASALECARLAEAEDAARGTAPFYRRPFHAFRGAALQGAGHDESAIRHETGIWRGVHLERWRTARIAGVRPLSTVDGDSGRVEVHVDVERASAAALTVYATVAGVEASASLPPDATDAAVVVRIPEVDRWWPAGHGPARLYDLAVDLHSEDEQLDEYVRRVGFRTVELDDAGGGVRVNGRPITLKGANWTPDDALLATATPSRVRSIVAHAAAANLNLLRVWGGGVYETCDFYAACDELGLLVWQDVPYTTENVVHHDALREEITAELRDNVTRLSPHPALAFYEGSGDDAHHRLVSSVLAELDPTRQSVRITDFAGLPDESDGAVPRVCTHVGIDDDATWPTVARAVAGGDHDAWHWAVQSRQAARVSHCVEEIRARGADAACAVVWHFNECWPSVAWAAVDAEGRRKPLWHALRRSFAARILVFPTEGRDDALVPARLVAVNDTDEAWEADLSIVRLTFDGRLLATTTAHVVAPPRDAASVDVPPAIATPGDPASEVVVASAGTPGGADHVRAVRTFVPDEDARCASAPFDAAVARIPDGYAITVVASGLVRGLTILADEVRPGAEARDGLVTLLPGEEATIAVTSHPVADPSAFLDRSVLVSSNALASR